MQQRDIIKDEIERLGRVLGKLITLVTGSSGGDMNLELRLKEVQDRLRNDLGLAPDDLLQLSRNDLILKLDDLQLTPNHLYQLGDFLTLWAYEEALHTTRATLYQRALLLYDRVFSLISFPLTAF
ncbi:MAG: hypothetical protein ACI81P_003470 [Neolewinella sp.]|jgi:hypothetical protein